MIFNIVDINGQAHSFRADDYKIENHPKGFMLKLFDDNNLLIYIGIITGLDIIRD